MNPGRYDVRLDCLCGNRLAYMRRGEDGVWENVDPRVQPTVGPARFVLNEHGTWEGSCRRCQYRPVIRADRLAYVLLKIRTAGITSVSLGRFA